MEVGWGGWPARLFGGKGIMIGRQQPGLPSRSESLRGQKGAASSRLLPLRPRTHKLPVPVD